MTSSSETYQLDKTVWINDDFNEMGWHDSLIYAFKVDQDLHFDLDYIFKWVQPDQDQWFSFWVAPCTLVFETPTKFKLNLESSDVYNYIEIADLHRQVNENNRTEWRIETHIGDIIIEAECFKQFVRRPPTFQTGQQIISEERGDVSFAITFDKDFIETEQIKQIKRDSFLLREKATNAMQLQKFLSNLFDQRTRNEIDTKTYILEKRKIERQISQIMQELKKHDHEHLVDPLR